MKKNHGYTLLEIMVALAVFSILATITAATMLHAFDTRARVSLQADKLNTIQVTLTLIAKDIQQIIERPVIGTEMHLFPPFIGTANYIEFTRNGVVNPNGMAQRSTLRRVAFLCKDKTLIRRVWPRLDAPNRESYQDKPLLDNLELCTFAYLSNSQDVSKEWRNDAGQQQKNEILPMAVQVNITIHKWGNMSLLFPIPEVLYGMH